MQKRMKQKHKNRLNELIIVNPGLPGGEEALDARQFFLGEDGILYRLGNIRTLPDIAPYHEIARDETTLGGYFLGDDGTLYKAI